MSHWSWGGGWSTEPKFVLEIWLDPWKITEFSPEWHPDPCQLSPAVFSDHYTWDLSSNYTMSLRGFQVWVLQKKSCQVIDNMLRIPQQTCHKVLCMLNDSRVWKGKRIAPPLSLRQLCRTWPARQPTQHRWNPQFSHPSKKVLFPQNFSAQKPWIAILSGQTPSHNVVLSQEAKSGESEKENHRRNQNNFSSCFGRLDLTTCWIHRWFCDWKADSYLGPVLIGHCGLYFATIASCLFLFTAGAIKKNSGRGMSVVVLSHTCCDPSAPKHKACFFSWIHFPSEWHLFLDPFALRIGRESEWSDFALILATTPKKPDSRELILYFSSRERFSVNGLVLLALGVAFTPISQVRDSWENRRFMKIPGSNCSWLFLISSTKQGPTFWNSCNPSIVGQD